MQGDKASIRKGVEYYGAEIAAIKRFLMKPKDTIQFQDWLRNTRPEARAITEKPSANAYPVDHPVFGTQSRYTNLLPLMRRAGMITYTPLTNGANLYTWVD